MRILRPPALILAVLALLIGVACSSDSTVGSGTGAAAEGEQAAALDTKEAEPFVPDPLADPGVAPGTCKIVTYTPSTAEEEQYGELCRPAGNQRDVAVMLVHGGSGIGGSLNGMDAWSNRLLAEGYVTFAVDYHLFTPGSGASPVFPQPEQNIKAATQYLRGTANATGIQRDRVVVQGVSAGARISAVAYATPDAPYFAGPELWPDISDEVNGFVGFYHPYDGSMQYSSQYYGGSDTSTETKIVERWDMADSMGNAAGANGPALLITGSKDWSLIVEQQNEFAIDLRSEGLTADTFVIEGGSHGFDVSGSKLTKLGEESATHVLVWLNGKFPQFPVREAQTGLVDLAAAPDRTGEAPVNFETRTRPSKSTAGKSTTTTTWKPSGTTTTTWTAPTSTVTSPPTTVTPTTVTPTTEAPTTSTTSSGGGGEAIP